MTRKLLLTLWVLAMAAAFGAAPGWSEVDQKILQKLHGDWTNLDGEVGRFVIGFDVTGGLLKKGYLDPQSGEYKELNTTRIKFTEAKGNLIKLLALDDETDSAECEFKEADQEVICRDNEASQVMHLKRNQKKEK